ncbi:MAG: hypothetical protein ACP5IO_02750 [Elusimicrobiales bacterium]
MSLKDIVLKTGLKKDDVKYIKFSFAGIVAILSSFLSSCSKNGVKELDNTAPSVSSTQTYVIEKSSNVRDIIDTPEDFKNKNCGPTPGYPCGTKYYTVSIKDFV